MGEEKTYKTFWVDLTVYEGETRKVVSEAVQKKLLEKGYRWVFSGDTIKHTWLSSFNCAPTRRLSTEAPRGERVTPEQILSGTFDFYFVEVPKPKSVIVSYANISRRVEMPAEATLSVFIRPLDDKAEYSVLKHGRVVEEGDL